MSEYDEPWLDLSGAFLISKILTNRLLIKCLHVNLICC